MFEKSTINPTKVSFSWDPDKDKSNFIKHGIYFSSAIKIFGDINCIYCKDDHNPYEERYNLIGRVNKVLFVVYTIRMKNDIRIISARKATFHEKEEYRKFNDED